MIDELMKAIEENKTLADQLSSAATPEEAVKIAEEAGYKITTTELLEAYKTKMATMSEEELANVSGGKGDKTSYNTYGDGNTQSSGQATYN